MLSFLFRVEQREWERVELKTFTLVKLVLELHPVKSQGVQEGTESFHHQQNSNGGADKYNYANYKDDYIVIPAADGHTDLSVLAIG